ncbi:hypothetical protein KAH55_09110 [bacterium]|nr:hypothetical protein [bacterium]
MKFPLITGKPQLPITLLNGQNIINLFCDYMIGFHTVKNFLDLPIPFFCVATDMETGKKIVLDHGFLPEAVLASMAIPGGIKPVIIENSVLSDGGIINYMSVDKMKEFGADIIIAIYIV